MSVQLRIYEFCKSQDISVRQFEISCGMSNGYVSSMRKGIGIEKLEQVLKAFPNLNREWLLYGEGSMLINRPSQQKIPLYDTQTIGGCNDLAAPTDEASHVAEWIDAGDWFPQATAAIHHYGDSMLEYPSGCILVLKDVHDRSPPDQRPGIRH